MRDGKSTPGEVPVGKQKTKAPDPTPGVSGAASKKQKHWFRPSETRCATCRYFELTPASALYFACQAPDKPVWADGECSAWRKRDDIETTTHERQNGAD